MKHSFFITLALAVPSSGHSMIPKKIPCCTSKAIVPYHPEYEKKISTIALKDITRFASPREHTDTEYKTLLHENILPCFYAKGLITRVFLKDTEPIGFITYLLYDPWYGTFIAHAAPHAEICLLAVEESERNKGIGSALVRAALRDLQEKSASRVSLWITASGIAGNLGVFYTKLGFTLARQTSTFMPQMLGEHSKESAQQYVLRLQPHPLRRLITHMLKK